MAVLVMTSCRKSNNTGGGFSCVCHITWATGTVSVVKDSTVTFPYSNISRNDAISECDAEQQTMGSMYGFIHSPGETGAQCTLQ